MAVMVGQTIAKHQLVVVVVGLEKTDKILMKVEMVEMVWISQTSLVHRLGKTDFSAGVLAAQSGVQIPALEQVG
jgi:hypothetical protein